MEGNTEKITKEQFLKFLYEYLQEKREEGLEYHFTKEELDFMLKINK